MIREDAPVGQTAQREIAQTTMNAQKNVLVIDDEEALLPLCRLILERAGYGVFTAGGGQQGIAVFREHAHEVDLLIVDYFMPDLNGEQVLDEVWRLSPGMKAVFASGQGDQSINDRLSGKGVVAVLQKPFTGKELIAMVCKAIGGPAATTTPVAPTPNRASDPAPNPGPSGELDKRQPSDQERD